MSIIYRNCHLSQSCLCNFKVIFTPIRYGRLQLADAWYFQRQAEPAIACQCHDLTRAILWMILSLLFVVAALQIVWIRQTTTKICSTTNAGDWFTIYSNFPLSMRTNMWPKNIQKNRRKKIEWKKNTIRQLILLHFGFVTKNTYKTHFVLFVGANAVSHRIYIYDDYREAQTLSIAHA